MRMQNVHGGRTPFGGGKIRWFGVVQSGGGNPFSHPGTVRCSRPAVEFGWSQIALQHRSGVRSPPLSFFGSGPEGVEFGQGKATGSDWCQAWQCRVGVGVRGPSCALVLSADTLSICSGRARTMLSKPQTPKVFGFHVGCLFFLPSEAGPRKIISDGERKSL